jgi:dolichol-phosphate mannosyltransferase
MVPSSGIEDVAVLDRDRMTGNVSLTTSPTLSIIIPTLNERDNIEPLVALLMSALAEIAREAIFVDDDSGDGTSDHVRALARANPRNRCLQRIGRRGLATACIEGVLASASPFVAVMDADLHHDERLLPDMLQPLESGTADLVVGSRYTSGGGVGDWSVRRARLSGLATRLVRLVCVSAWKIHPSGGVISV